MNKLENVLDNIVLKLDKIINLLEKTKVENKITSSSHFNTLNMLDAIGEEIPLPTPWNNPSTPTCKSDILYKEPKKPNWYSIKDNGM
jgi:hypothetical protein